MRNIFCDLEMEASSSTCIFCPNQIQQNCKVDKEALKESGVALSNLFKLLELDMAEVWSSGSGSGGPDNLSANDDNKDKEELIKAEMLVQFMCGTCVYLTTYFGEEGGGGSKNGNKTGQGSEGGGESSRLLQQGELYLQMWMDRINGVSFLPPPPPPPPHGGQSNGNGIHIKSEILQCCDSKIKPASKVKLLLPSSQVGGATIPKPGGDPNGVIIVPGTRGDDEVKRICIVKGEQRTNKNTEDHNYARPSSSSGDNHGMGNNEGTWKSTTQFDAPPGIPDYLDAAMLRLTTTTGKGQWGGGSGKKECTLCSKAFLEDANIRKHLIIQHCTVVKRILEENGITIEDLYSGSKKNPVGKTNEHNTDQPAGGADFQPTPEQMLDDAIFHVIHGPANIQHRRKRIFHCQLCSKECEMTDLKSHVMEFHYDQVKNMAEAQYVRE